MPERPQLLQRLERLQWRTGQIRVPAQESDSIRIQPDGKVSLLTARCIGACGIAPAVTYDGHVAPKQTPEAALEKIGQWK